MKTFENQNKTLNQKLKILNLITKFKMMIRTLKLHLLS